MRISSSAWRKYQRAHSMLQGEAKAQLEEFFESRGYSVSIGDEDAELGGKTPKYGLDESVYIEFGKPEDATDVCVWAHAIEDAADTKRYRPYALECGRDGISPYEVYKDQQAFDEGLSKLWFELMSELSGRWEDDGRGGYRSLD